MNSPYNEYIGTKNLTDKQMIYQNKHVDAKWMGTFGEQETNSYKSKSLLLLISKILTNQCLFSRKYLVWYHQME